jgi:S1-C subfamily serine protease
VLELASNQPSRNTLIGLQSTALTTEQAAWQFGSQPKRHGCNATLHDGITVVNQVLDNSPAN